MGRRLENGGEAWRCPTLVVTADVGELVLEMGEDLLESYNGLLLGRVRRSEVNGLSGRLGGVWVSLWMPQESNGGPTMVGDISL